MKFAIYIFTLFTLSNCDSQSLEDLTLNYNAITRGSSVRLIANSSEINYSDVNGSKSITPTPKQWDEIKKLVSKIDLNSIESIKAPSEESHTDKALIAILSITINNKTYESVNFDHGNPPIEFKKLIDRLFEIVN